MKTKYTEQKPIWVTQRKMLIHNLQEEEQRLERHRCRQQLFSLHCLFVYLKTVSVSKIRRTECWMIENTELKRLWKKSVVAIFNILSWHFLDWQENHKTTLSYNNQIPARDSNRICPRHKPKALLFELTYSVLQYKEMVRQGTALASTNFHSADCTQWNYH
jgi:hypothetical protein